MKNNYYMKKMRYTEPLLVHSELNAVVETMDIVSDNLATELKAIREFAEGSGISSLIGNIERQYIPILYMLQRNISNLAEEVLELENKGMRD